MSLQASAVKRNTEAELLTNYPALSAAHKKVYDELMGHIQAMETTFELKSEFKNEDLVTILRAIRFDHPELFWFSEASSLQVTTTGSKVVAKTLTLNTYYPIKDVPAMQTKIDAIVKNWAASLPKGASTYDKVHEAYDFVIDNTTYDLNAPNNQSMAAVFLNKKAVCAGYSNAFDYLLRAVGVPSGTVQGMAKSGSIQGPHLWNIVCIDGVYTHVDTTWGELEVANSSGQKTEGRTHNYLCVTTEEIMRSRSIDASQSIPECTSRKYDYFAQQGLLLDGFVANDYDAMLASACEKGKRELAVKFKTKAAFEKCLEWIGASKIFTGTFGKKLSRTLKSNQVSISWTRDDKLWIVNVIW